MSTAWNAIEAAVPNDNTAVTHTEFNEFVKKLNAAMHLLTSKLDK